MRPRTVSDAFAEVTFCSEAQNEDLRPATYRETAAAIFMALAEAGLEYDPSGDLPWTCEIELLDELSDVPAQVPKANMRKKH